MRKTDHLADTRFALNLKLSAYVRRKVSATFEKRFIFTVNSWQNDALQRRENTERSDADYSVPQIKTTTKRIMEVVQAEKKPRQQKQNEVDKCKYDLSR